MNKCIDCGKVKSLPKYIRCRKCCDKFRSGVNNSSYKHGMRRTRFYGLYKSMCNRCKKPSQTNYYLYGGRGIKCLWNSFEEFRDNMYESYQAHVKEFGEKDTTIDRIDNNGNYCKENCRWETQKEQARNKRNNHLITYNGITKCLSQWVEDMGLTKSSVEHRLTRAWSIEKALTTPVIKGRNQFTK